MPKTATIEGKIGRINEQIGEAKDEFEALAKQIEAVDGELSSELGKVNLNQVKVEELESGREKLVRSQARLSIRVTALEATIGDNEEALSKAQLKDAIARHPGAIEDVNEAIKLWKVKSEGVTKLAAAGQNILEKLEALGLVVSEIRYLSVLLEKDRPQLAQPDSLTAKDMQPVSENMRRATLVTPDPWGRNRFDAKLEELNKKKKEKEWAIAEEKNRATGKAQGW